MASAVDRSLGDALRTLEDGGLDGATALARLCEALLWDVAADGGGQRASRRDVWLLARLLVAFLADWYSDGDGCIDGLRTLLVLEPPGFRGTSALALMMSELETGRQVVRLGDGSLSEAASTFARRDGTRPADCGGLDAGRDRTVALWRRWRGIAVPRRDAALLAAGRRVALLASRPCAVAEAAARAQRRSPPWGGAWMADGDGADA